MNNPTFGINGFGRIGRTTLRVWWQYYQEQSTIKAINTSGSMDLEGWAHLLKYDSNYGHFPGEIIVDQQQTRKQVTDQNQVLGTLILKDPQTGHQTEPIVITAQRDPAKLKWAELGVNTVLESTGVFRTADEAKLHMTGGAKQVILSAPGKSDGISTSVLGVGSSNSGDIVSNASCTTNCVAPVAQIMHSTFGVTKAIMTTIHSYTDDQNTQDNSHKDLRRARSAAENIIPTTTGAAIATTEIVPELAGLFDGIAVRVPTATGSLSDMIFVTAKPVTIEEVNQTFIDATKQDRWQGLLAVTTDPIVSSDIVGRTESSIVDLSLTNVIGGDLVKVVSWYDNEWGYCCRYVEQVAQLAAEAQR